MNSASSVAQQSSVGSWLPVFQVSRRSMFLVLRADQEEQFLQLMLTGEENMG
jgi:hypothetical protein